MFVVTMDLNRRSTTDTFRRRKVRQLRTRRNASVIRYALQICCPSFGYLLNLPSLVCYLLAHWVIERSCLSTSNILAMSVNMLSGWRWRVCLGLWNANRFGSPRHHGRRGPGITRVLFSRLDAILRSCCSFAIMTCLHFVCPLEVLRFASHFPEGETYWV